MKTKRGGMKIIAQLKLSIKVRKLNDAINFYANFLSGAERSVEDKEIYSNMTNSYIYVRWDIETCTIEHEIISAIDVASLIQSNFHFHFQ